MSSVVAFFRALVMLACLVAVPLLAITHSEAVSRATQAAARVAARFAGEIEQADSDAAVTVASPRSVVAGFPEQDSVRLGLATRPGPQFFPEPLDDQDSRARVALGQADTRLETRLASLSPPSEEPSSTPTASTDARVTAWQEMAGALKQLGAVEYALEKWGRSGELYRFRCLVAVAGSESYRKHFQAVDADGGRAVQRVIEEVQSWRRAAPVTN